MQSQAHLVEIDLLRAGKRPVRTFHAGGDFYAVYLNRAPLRRRTRALFWPLPKPLPIIPIPLRDPDPPARLDLQRALILAYERGAYGASIDYKQPPMPPLTEENADWAEAVIAKALGGQ